MLAAAAPAGFDFRQLVKGKQIRKREEHLRRTEGTRLLARAGMDLQRQYAENFHDFEQGIQRTAIGADAGTVTQGFRDAADTAGADAERAFAAGDRERSSLGLGPASQSAVRRQGLARVLAEVDAANRSSQSAVRRQEAAQDYGLQQWGSSASNAMDALSYVARSEQDRFDQHRRAKADYKANMIGTISSLAGAGIGALV